MQYTEEHYAEMYNNLPEGLKDLVLSGRLAILVSAIGSRHGLNADQISDLEPAIEDVCLGLITKEELVENIHKSTGVDQRVSNRIAAEAELEILKPFEAELVIARHQKEELDQKIVGGSVKPVYTAPKIEKTEQPKPKVQEPQNVSEHALVKKVGDWYSKDEQNLKDEDTKAPTPRVTNFDWEKDFGKKEVSTETTAENATPTPAVLQPIVNLESKIDELAESIKLINARFGLADSTTKGDTGLSAEMQALAKRLEMAEKENEENKKLIKNLQSNNTTKAVESLFPGIATQDKAEASNKIPIDKQRKVEIDHTAVVPKSEPVPSGNIQITSISNQIPIQKQEEIFTQPIVSSTVSKDTLDSIVETKNKPTPTINNIISDKKTLTLSELVADSDKKIKEGMMPTDIPQKSKTLVFPGLNEEKKVDIKNINNRDSMRMTLLSDLEFLKKSEEEKSGLVEEKVVEEKPKVEDTQTPNMSSFAAKNATTTYDSNPFKEELLPKTKEERMRILQEKIKGLNKGISVGGKTNLSPSDLDPYKL